MRSLFYISLMAWVAVVTGRCSTATESCTSVEQDRIHQSLSSSYNTSRNETSASATLRFGDGTGTTLEMTGNCRITHSLYTLDKVNILGTSYNGSRSGLNTTHTFTFTNNDGRSFSNSATLSAVSITSPPTTLSKAAGATVTFTPAVVSGEYVYAYVSDSESRLGSASTSAAGATTVTLTASDLTSLLVGAGELYVVRRKSATLSEAAGAGGSFSTTYESGHSTITITN